jgi:hypothetical protein
VSYGARPLADQAEAIWVALRTELLAPAAGALQVAELLSLEEVATAAAACLTALVQVCPLPDRASMASLQQRWRRRRRRRTAAMQLVPPSSCPSTTHTHTGMQAFQADGGADFVGMVQRDACLEDLVACVAAPGQDSSTFKRAVQTSKTVTRVACAVRAPR